MVEGPTSASHKDVDQRAFQISQHIASRDPQRRVSRPLQRFIADGVSRRPVARRMRLAVDLDRQSSFEASKVDDIPLERILTAEAQSFGPSAKVLPQEDFGQRHRPAKLASLLYVRGASADSAMADAPAFGPSTKFHLVPLPVPGRILRRVHHSR